jgi:hypothetical protein
VNSWFLLKLHYCVQLEIQNQGNRINFEVRVFMKGPRTIITTFLQCSTSLDAVSSAAPSCFHTLARVHTQGRLNVTAHPATAGGLASTSFKIGKTKFFIVLYLFIILTKSVNFILRDMFSFWIIIEYCIFVCYEATIQFLFPHLSLAILNHRCWLSYTYLFIVTFSRLVLCVMKSISHTQSYQTLNSC